MRINKLLKFFFILGLLGVTLPVSAQDSTPDDLVPTMMVKGDALNDY